MNKLSLKLWYLKAESSYSKVEHKVVESPQYKRFHEAKHVRDGSFYCFFTAFILLCLASAIATSYFLEGMIAPLAIMAIAMFLALLVGCGLIREEKEEHT